MTIVEECRLCVFTVFARTLGTREQRFVSFEFVLRLFALLMEMVEYREPLRGLQKKSR